MKAGIPSWPFSFPDLFCPALFLRARSVVSFVYPLRAKCKINNWGHRNLLVVEQLILQIQVWKQSIFRLSGQSFPLFWTQLLPCWLSSCVGMCLRYLRAFEARGWDGLAKVGITLMGKYTRKRQLLRIGVCPSVCELLCLYQLFTSTPPKRCSLIPANLAFNLLLLKLLKRLSKHHQAWLCAEFWWAGSQTRSSRIRMECLAELVMAADVSFTRL